jgi:phosphatidate cytidylyltransferase
MSSLLSRLVVGAIGLPLVLGLVWLGGWWVVGLALAAGLIALHELYTMVRPLGPLVAAGYAGLALTIVATHSHRLDWMLGAVFSTIVLSFLLKGIADTRAPVTAAVGATLLGSVWIGLGLAHLVLIRGIPHHAQLAAFVVLLAVWAGDTMAYFIGRLAGRHKLAPAISPGKTWEGFVAGTIATVFVCWVALYKDRDDFLSNWQAVVLGVVIAVVGPLGDLFESALKRDMQVKDSGRLLAGHGGMLDRVDAILFATVAAFYVLDAFGKT